MVNLKPGDFPRDRGVCRELLEGTGPGGTRLPLVFLGHDLDQSFMRTLHERLGAELPAAAIPCKGLLFVTGEIAPPAVLKFALMAETQYRDAEGGALSPVVFLARDGKVVGHLDTSARPS